MNTLVILLIKGYQKYISKGLGEGKCKFVPTCSQYALEAFQNMVFSKRFCYRHGEYFVVILGAREDMIH